MTDLQAMYLVARVEGDSTHRKALRMMGKSTGLDEGTLTRALARARREDEKDARRAKKASSKQVTSNTACKVTPHE